MAGIGFADRLIDDRVLMDLPELYWYGRKRYYFSFTKFFEFMMDGLYQVSFHHMLLRMLDSDRMFLTVCDHFLLHCLLVQDGQLTDRWL